MNVLALDLATHTGWALMEQDRLESGVETFDVRRGESPGMRYVKFSRWLEDFVCGRLGEGNREERAWAAGFFDGEGCAGCYQMNNGRPSGSPALVVQISQVHREALERFQKAVGGIGKIQGPFPGKGNQQPIHRYRTSSLADGRRVIAAIWPWLGSVKRAQVDDALVDKILGAKIPQEPRSDWLIAFEAAHQRGGAATEVAAGLATRVLEFCSRYGIEHASVHSATLKKFVTGKGNASKTDMLEAVARRWKRVDTDDEADALGLLYYALAELVPAAAASGHV